MPWSTRRGSDTSTGTRSASASSAVPRVLLLVRDHELRREREHRVDVDVLRAADRRDAVAVLAVGGPADEPIAGAERDTL